VIVPHFWVPAETAHEKEKRTACPTRRGSGRVRDADRRGTRSTSQAIRKFLNEIDAEYPIQEIGYDDWNATELSRQLREEDGFGERMVPVRQGSKSLSDPMKEFEAMVMSGRIEHGNNPAMDWMIGNVCVKRDENGNIQPDKKKSTEKIDGPVATFTGMARALAAPLDDPEMIDALLGDERARRRRRARRAALGAEALAGLARRVPRRQHGGEDPALRVRAGRDGEGKHYATEHPAYPLLRWQAERRGHGLHVQTGDDRPGDPDGRTGTPTSTGPATPTPAS
jgi:hypothetical protein